jgi:hypothetical protein
LKRREKIGWLAIGLIYIVGLLGLLPGHYEICEVAEKTKEENCTAYRMLPFAVVKVGKILDDHNGAVTAVFTVVLAISTIGLWVATRKLWDAGERQLKLATDTSAAQSLDMKESIAAGKIAAEAASKSADLAEQALIVSQRAIVSVKTPRGEPLRNVQTKRLIGWRFWIEWINTGNTQTENIICGSYGNYYDEELPIDAPFEVGHLDDQAIIAPHAVIEGAPWDLNDSMIQEIVNQTKFCYMWGHAEYDDVFAPKTPRHVVEYFYRVVFDGDPVGGGGHLITFRIHGPHNRHYDIKRHPEE